MLWSPERGVGQNGIPGRQTEKSCATASRCSMQMPTLSTRRTSGSGSSSLASATGWTASSRWRASRPTTRSGSTARYTQHPTVLYGQFQKLINWTQEDMIAKYGDCMVHGFRGDLVAEAIARDGIDIAVIYGPEFDLWYSGIDPEMQAAMVRAYNRWGAEMAETSGGRVLAAAPDPPQRRQPGHRRDPATPTTTSAPGRSGPGPTSSTAAPSATATTTRSGSCCRISASPSPPTSSWGSSATPSARSASAASWNGTPSCTPSRPWAP